MQDITLEELKRQVDKQFSGLDNNYLVVLLGMQECRYCEIYRKALADIEEELLTYNIEFYYLELVDGIPLFAPNVLPSLVCFNKGVRVWEGKGLVEDVNIVKKSLLSKFYGEHHWHD